MFSCSKIVSFEILIPNKENIDGSFEDEQCNLFNLIRVNDLVAESEAGSGLVPILLVPDDIKDENLNKLKESILKTQCWLARYGFIFPSFSPTKCLLNPLISYKTVQNLEIEILE